MNLDEIVRDLHTKMPMATQEDAITFAHRLVAELAKQEPAHSDHPMQHWDRTCPACNTVILADVFKDYAAAQARIVELREASTGDLIDMAYDALSTSDSTAELDAVMKNVESWRNLENKMKEQP